MYDWIKSTFNWSNKANDKNKYCLQMSLTLSTHPILEKYREERRASNQREPYNKDIP